MRLSTQAFIAGGVLLGHALVINDLPVFIDRNYPELAGKIEQRFPSVKDVLLTLDPVWGLSNVSDVTRPLGALLLLVGVALRLSGR